LSDERAAVIAALEKPIGSRSLFEWISPESRICIAFTDITRATPNERIIPWLLDHLRHVPADRITLLNSLGTHRPNTRVEWEEMRDIALRIGPCFLLNVTLNEARRITGVFAGDLMAAHRAGIEFVRQAAMQKVKSPFEIVVTTNSGYPLDLNLYQGVKGMSAAARIVQERGTIILACECREGVPTGSPLDQLLRSASSPEQILTMLATPGF